MNVPEFLKRKKYANFDEILKIPVLGSHSPLRWLKGVACHVAASLTAVVDKLVKANIHSNLIAQISVIHLKTLPTETN